MQASVTNSNPKILRQCREQLNLNIDDVKTKIPTIVDIEKGDRHPTFNQLDILEKLYKVPRWVFISEFLPARYQFKEVCPAFRQFADSPGEIFDNFKARSLTATVSQLRDLIMEFQEDMDEPVDSFASPALQKNISPEGAAKEVRKWLQVSEENFDFSQWKEKLEKKNIFIFMTSKYKGWSHIDKEIFRGLAIYYSTLPVIIINDSDAKKAQSFTLFHELGHLLRQESSIDGWNTHRQRQTEKWCDQFAGSVLIPAESVQDVDRNINNLGFIDKIAKKFKVSPYACLVRMKQLEIISQTTYETFETALTARYKEQQKKFKDQPGGPPRNRPTEVLNQYGRIYANIVFQTYKNGDIGLHKLCKLFDLKRASHALQLEKLL